MTETVCEVDSSASAELLTCCCHQCVANTSPDSTRSQSELLDTAYVASTRICTTIRGVARFPAHAVAVPSGSL